VDEVTLQEQSMKLLTERNNLEARLKQGFSKGSKETEQKQNRMKAIDEEIQLLDKRIRTFYHGFLALLNRGHDLLFTPDQSAHHARLYTFFNVVPSPLTWHVTKLDSTIPSLIKSNKQSKRDIRVLQADVRKLNAAEARRVEKERESAENELLLRLKSVNKGLQKKLAKDVLNDDTKFVADVINKQKAKELDVDQKAIVKQFETDIGRDLETFKDLVVEQGKDRDEHAYIGEYKFKKLDKKEMDELMDTAAAGPKTRKLIIASKTLCPDMWSDGTEAAKMRKSLFE
jgi:hypothetical protein